MDHTGQTNAVHPVLFQFYIDQVILLATYYLLIIKLHQLVFVKEDNQEEAAIVLEYPKQHNFILKVIKDKLEVVKDSLEVATTKDNLEVTKDSLEAIKLDNLEVLNKYILEAIKKDNLEVTEKDFLEVTKKCNLEVIVMYNPQRANLEEDFEVPYIFLILN